MTFSLAAPSSNSSHSPNTEFTVLQNDRLMVRMVRKSLGIRNVRKDSYHSGTLGGLWINWVLHGTAQQKCQNVVIPIS